jgi:hypothetical protein
MRSLVLEAIAPTRNRTRTGVPAKNQKWTSAEDSLLQQSVIRSTSINWKSLEPQFPGKTSQQLFERWTKVLNPVLLKGSWTRQEDEVILNFVRVHGCKSWTKLSKMLPGRIGKQCRERWMNHLNPDLVRGPWTTQEDALLIHLHAEFGNKWSQIAACMPGRADNMIKNRWYSILSKKSPEELAELQPTAQPTMPAPTLEDHPTEALRGWTPPTLGLISPGVQMISPFTMMSPYQKMSMFSPWIPETPKNEVLSPTHKKHFAPSLSENRAELLNLLVQQ